MFFPGKLGFACQTPKSCCLKNIGLALKAPNKMQLHSWGVYLKLVESHHPLMKLPFAFAFVPLWSPLFGFPLVRSMLHQVPKTPLKTPAKREPALKLRLVIKYRNSASLKTPDKKLSLVIKYRNSASLKTPKKKLSLVIKYGGSLIFHAGLPHSFQGAFPQNPPKPWY